MTIVCGMLLLAGCGKVVLHDDLRLKKDIVIEGRNVSAMTVAEARAALQADAKTRLGARSLELALPNARTRFSIGALGAQYDIESALAEAAKLGARGGNRRISMQLMVDEAVLDAVLRTYADQGERPAMDAAFLVDKTRATPVVYRAEQTGVSIDRAVLKSNVMAAIQNSAIKTVEVPSQWIAPAVTLAGIQRNYALVARYATSFSSAAHSAPNRVFNMRKAAEAINGTVLQPGDRFDCNAILGERTEANGWRLAPGIRNGRYEDEYGGGVCQISSTLFNAVMMADLTITERHPHSWPMGYVEIGRDATISTGGKNFCFLNSSSAPATIYLHVDTEEKTVTASIYGAPLARGGYIDVVSEKTGTVETAGEIVMLDESLPSQTRKVEREARDGKTAATYKEYRSADGTLIDRVVAYQDTYHAVDGLTYVSTDLYYPESGASNETDQPQSTHAPEEHAPDSDGVGIVDEAAGEENAQDAQSAGEMADAEDAPGEDAGNRQ